MVLVDTSVWVDHFRNGNALLKDLLNDGTVWCHDFIIGEIACGHLNKRREILSLMKALPRVTVAEHEEVLAFIDTNTLMGKGIGLIDAHLLASALLSQVKIWTLDKKLHMISERLHIKYATS
jgi:predicted nucleic acid-binding protein